MSLPQTGLSREEMFARLEAYSVQDLATHGGRTWAYVYDSGLPQVEAAAKEAYLRFLSPNGLDPTVFPSLVKLENDLTALAAGHLSGGPDACGSFTSGGTESIILAVKTAREWARANRPEIQTPEMVLPLTAHAAFHKAAAYLGVKAVLAEVDPTTFKADPQAMAEAITPNTILLVGSAPSYAHGVIDPIPELGRLAEEKGLLLHVDACVGGWLLPYFQRLGAQVTPFDFSVPGVTSMSMDWHKYGYCPKGASMVMYRDRALRRHQFFACASWTGYTVINATIQSSKTGGPLAAAWATLNMIGDDGYLEIARKTKKAVELITARLERIPELKLLARPEFSLIAFTSDEVSVFNVIDEMKDQAWYIQPQLSFAGSKENIHLSVSAVSLEMTEAMMDDLEAAVDRAKAAGPDPAAAGIKAMAAGLDPASLNPQMLDQLLGAAGISGGALPDKMAAINEIMNALPAEVTEQILIEYFNQLF